MIGPLQGFGFQESNYERPNQEWECGWAAQGEPCRIGPDGSGICQAHRECVPIKEGDRYRCARPRSFGGECETGPNPDGCCSQRVAECRPVRSLRAKRRMLTFTTAALALGVCLVLFGSSWNNSIPSPGDLTLQHHSNVQTCADCHAAAETSLAHWFTGAADFETTSNDSMRCLKCHENLGRHPLLAHGMSVEQLKMKTESRQEKSAAGGAEPLVFSLLDAAAGPLKAAGALDVAHPLDCHLCHREHRGRNFDLTRMTNRQCQICHTGRFHSFGDGHPEFAGFPYGRRTRIHFDHVTHYQVHFKTYERIKPEAVLPELLRDTGDGPIPSAESCRACHQADPAGRTMPIRGFEHSCATCHAADLEDDALPGLPLIALPKISDRLLTADGPAIGQWPGQAGVPAEKQYDVQVTPLMQLMLAADADYMLAREMLHTTDWNQLSEAEAEAERRELLQQQLWSIKRLLHELVTEGEEAGARRLSHLQPLLCAEVAKDSTAGNPPEIAALTAALFHDPTFVKSLAAIQQRWFPDLAREIREMSRNAPPPASNSRKEQVGESADDAGAAAGADDPTAGWYAALPDGSVRYRAKGHTDRLLRALLDLTGAVPPAPGGRDTGTAKPYSVAATVRASSAELFGIVGDPTATFRCLGCHTADRQDDGRLVINWEGRHVNPTSQSFTTFSHAPHVTLLVERRDKNDCGHCHVPRDQINFVHDDFVNVRDGYSANTNPHATLTSGFRPVMKSTCAECHTNQLAGDNCLKCHNYHVFE